MFVGRRIAGGNINERTGPGAVEVHMSAFYLCYKLLLTKRFLTLKFLITIGGLKI